MSQRIEEYSVGQLARLSGVSVRTLHHYDQIGLLRPGHVQLNGYRLYRRADLLRLQEILFYRSTEMPLADIAALLDSAEPAVARLTRHRAAVAEKAAQAKAILTTLDATIAHLKGERDMANVDLYAPFAQAKQAEYETWLIETYGPEMADQIAASKVAVGDSPEAVAPLMARLKDVEARLVDAFEAGIAPAAKENHAVVEDHRALIADFWGKTCPPDAYAGLADMYLGHPDFVARYERLSPKFSAWLPAAMQAHAARLLQGR
ncbi:MerR family transcriptional regulator [Tabrizicola sp.]|uniref:MerR family transcriptional regulator n=1 Tax=Tabrizicola sp. TaxID=2005166 RepID=UPI003F325067